MRSSLLIDLSQGKRIEVEALHGAVVRRAARGRRAGADHVDAVCAAEAMGEPTRLSDRVVARVAAQRAERRVDADEDRAADVRVDHLLERGRAPASVSPSCRWVMAQPEVDRRAVASATASCIMREAGAPVCLARRRARNASSSVAPSRRRPQQRCSLISCAASSKRPSSSYDADQDVAGFFEARHQIADAQRFVNRVAVAAGEVMRPGDADVVEDRQRIEIAGASAPPVSDFVEAAGRSIR